MRKLTAFWLVLMMLAMPLAVFAEGESFNPPGWAGAGMFFLALILPIATGIWLKNRQNY